MRRAVDTGKAVQCQLGSGMARDVLWEQCVFGAHGDAVAALLAYRIQEVIENGARVAAGGVDVQSGDGTGGNLWPEDRLM